MNQKFYGVNYTHTYQLHDDTFFIGMEVQGTIVDKPEEMVLILSVAQMEDIIKYYQEQLDNRDEEE